MAMSCYVELWEIIPSDQVIFIQRPGGSPWKMLSKKWTIGFWARCQSTRLRQYRASRCFLDEKCV